MTRPRVNALAASAALLVAFAVLYRGVIVKLVSDWATDDNYSHGFLILPIALYFVWERRRKLLTMPPAPSSLGLVVVVGSIATLVAGVLGAELFLTRISIIGLVGGVVLYTLGWRHLRVVAFPIAFLLLMVPLPAIIFNQIAFPLQLLASRFGEATLQAASIPVLREGNVIYLANTTLEVAEACSGIRSLVSLLTLGIVYGYFSDGRGWMRWLIALATVPIAIVTNGLRVAGTGIAAHFYGPEAALGFFHEFSGWLVFVAAFALLFLVVRILLALAPDRSRTPPRPPVVGVREKVTA
jgi:exosortase